MTCRRAAPCVDAGAVDRSAVAAARTSRLPQPPVRSSGVAGQPRPPCGRRCSSQSPTQTRLGALVRHFPPPAPRRGCFRHAGASARVALRRKRAGRRARSTRAPHGRRRTGDRGRTRRHHRRRRSNRRTAAESWSLSLARSWCPTPAKSCSPDRSRSWSPPLAVSWIPCLATSWSRDSKNRCSSVLARSWSPGPQKLVPDLRQKVVTGPDKKTRPRSR